MCVMPQSVRHASLISRRGNTRFEAWWSQGGFAVSGQGRFTSMMHHNHCTHARKGVKYDNAPQGIGIDAPSGVANDGGFCGWSAIRPTPC